MQTTFRRRALDAAQEHRLGVLITGRPDATLRGAPGRAADDGGAQHVVAGDRPSGPDRQKKRSTPTNSAVLTSPRRAASGARRRRCATCARTSFSMSVASPPTCCGAMVGVRAAPDSTTTRRAVTGRPTPSSRAYGRHGLTAPAVFDGPIDNPQFSRLRRASPRAHRFARARSSSSTTSRCTNNRRSRRRSKASGATIRFLPPYSPDFNPIEQAFAKLKAFLRAARPRSYDQVWRSSRTPSRSTRRPSARTTCSTQAIASLHTYEKRQAVCRAPPPPSVLARSSSNHLGLREEAVARRGGGARLQPPPHCASLSPAPQRQRAPAVFVDRRLDDERRSAPLRRQRARRP